MVSSNTFYPGVNNDKINAILIEEFDILPNASENTAAFNSEDFLKLFGHRSSEEKAVQIGEKFFRAKEIDCLKKGHVGVTAQMHKELQVNKLVFTKYLAVPIHPSSLNTSFSSQSSQKPVTAQKTINQAKTVLNHQPLEINQTQKISFREFLQKAGWVGLPEDLEATLNPIFAAYGPLKHVVQYRDIRVEKGIILSGPPGTGKTSFARKLAEYLNCKPENVKILSATELLNHRVGGTEEHIRDLFNPAKKAMKEFGEHSPLFMIIIDEFDSISASRSLSQHAWERTQVNEFLSSMDGVTELNNILIIALTNNEEIIDEAFFRPGRFGTEIKIGFPLENQRKEIFEVYLNPLKEKGLLSSDVDIEALVKATIGFTGADIRGLIDKVQNNVMARLQKLYDKGQMQLEAVIQFPLNMQDFIQALDSFTSTQQRQSALSQRITQKTQPGFLRMSKL